MKKILQNPWVQSIAITLACMLVGGELFIRLFNIPTTGMPLRQVEVYHGDTVSHSNEWGTGILKRPSPFPEIKMGENIPNLNFRFVYASNPRQYFDKENAVYSRINSFGFRGTDFSLQKPADTYRILGVGDSFTFGEGVNEQDTFLSRLQRQLAAQHPTQTFEAINAGTSGYNTQDEVISLTKRWLKLTPDLVILTFTMNDGYADDEFADSTLGPLIMGIQDGRTRIPGQGREYPSKLLTWGLDLIERKRSSEQIVDLYLSQYTNQPVLEGYDWENSKQNFALANNAVSAINGKMILVIFPELFRLNDNYPFQEIHDKVAAEARRQGILVLDLLPVFQPYQAEDLWVHPTDHHPNEVAHDIAAQALFDFIEKNIDL